MKKSVKVMIAGAVLFVGSLLFGVGGTVIGMIRSFNQVASSGQANPEELAAEWVSTSLVTTYDMHTHCIYWSMPFYRRIDFLFPWQEQS